MLTRREALAAAIDVATGASLVDPIARRLGAPPGRLAGNDHGVPRVGLVDIEAIEHSTRYFAATDAEVGGALSREAAAGQLKYAVDLARHGSYSERTGNRLLAAVAELAGLVGWLCHDSKMPGPAQRYFTYGLQAARESTDPRAPLLVISILSDMAQHMKWLGRPNTAVRLHDLAINQLPHDRSRFNVLRAVLATKRAEHGLCYLGASCLPEVQSALSLSIDLYGQASDEDRATASSLWHRAIDTSEAELSAMAAATYLVMAHDDPKLAAEVEQRTLRHLARVGDGQGRNKLFSLIRLASARFIAGEPEQACDDGERALAIADDCASAMVTARLRDLVADAEPYRDVLRVREMRERVRAAIAR
jgi:hypothetical protein